MPPVRMAWRAPDLALPVPSPSVGTYLIARLLPSRAAPRRRFRWLQDPCHAPADVRGQREQAMYAKHPRADNASGRKEGDRAPGGLRLAICGSMLVTGPRDARHSAGGRHHACGSLAFAFVVSQHRARQHTRRTMHDARALCLCESRLCLRLRGFPVFWLHAPSGAHTPPDAKPHPAPCAAAASSPAP